MQKANNFFFPNWINLVVGSHWSVWLEIRLKTESTVLVIDISHRVDLTAGPVVGYVPNCEGYLRIGADVGNDEARIGAWLLIKQWILSSGCSVFVKNAVAIVGPFVNEDFA